MANNICCAIIPSDKDIIISYAAQIIDYNRTLILHLGLIYKNSLPGHRSYCKGLVFSVLRQITTSQKHLRNFLKNYIFVKPDNIEIVNRLSI
jgi:hypothetical protein